MNWIRENIAPVVTIIVMGGIFLWALLLAATGRLDDDQPRRRNGE